jgi:RimJ/RimL family protein N-acetyltransferase
MTSFTIPELRTERLVMRAPKASDLAAYAEYRASERSVHVGGPNTWAQSYNLLCAIAGQWVMRGYGRWVLADKADDTPLGVSGIYHPEDWPEAELAWTVFAAAEGKGIAYEAALAAREYAYKTLGWTTLISLVAADNTRSTALARRLGCHQDGVFDSDAFGAMPVFRHPAPGATI